MPSEQYVIPKNQIEKEGKLTPKEREILCNFRKEILNILKEYKEREVKSIPEIFVGHLDIEDALMWGKINNPELNSDTLDELKEYQKDQENPQNDLGKYMKELKNSTNYSRAAFLALFISKIIQIQYKKGEDARNK